MPKKLPKLVVSILEFDPSEIADSLRITKKQVISALQDGRGAWPFSEIWGERLYEFIKHSNTNQPVSDGAVALRQLGDMNVSVKALTRGGVKFQQSKFVGSGRRATKQDLITSIEGCDRIVIVDITEFPIVRFLPVDAPRLVGAAHSGKLTVSGWSKMKLYEWVNATYEISELQLAL